MSLSDYNSGGNNKKNNSIMVYSNYNMTNPVSEVDATALSSSFFNKLLKLTISPKKQGSSEERPEWDDDNSISIYLTHTKARTFYNEICLFQENPEQFSNVGVNSGAGLVSLSNGRELGTNNPCLIIRKLNGETGEVESSYAYEFKQNYHYSIRNFSQEDLEFDKSYYMDMEIEQLKTLLKTYFESMTNAVAYSILENEKYNNSRMNTKLDSIAEKLGIEYKGGNSKSSKSSNSIFNSKEPRNNFNSGTIDDIEKI